MSDLSDIPYGAYELTENNAAAVAEWCGGKVVQEKDAVDEKITHWAVNFQGVDEVERAHAGDVLIFNHEKDAYEILKN